VVARVEEPAEPTQRHPGEVDLPVAARPGRKDDVLAQPDQDGAAGVVAERRVHGDEVGVDAGIDRACEAAS
jgi:hypothetical protein